VLRSRQVTSDVIAGALASYLMIGLTWAIAYGLAETMAPGSIQRGRRGARGSSDARLLQLHHAHDDRLRDVTPVSAAARVPGPWLEGVIGMAFTTIILATLVAILLREKPKE